MNSDMHHSDLQWLKRMLSHNVRMPMSVILGYEELLKQGLLSVKEQRVAMQTICENITYMNDALKVLLEGNADGEMTVEEMPAKAVDIVLLVRRIEAFVSEIAKKSGISISIHTQDSSMLVQAEYFSLMRVFYQMFENAFKYLQRGNHISIQIYYAGEDQILVVYKDNGKGLPKEERKHIFERGFRGKNSRGKAGSGYGLHDIQQAIEKMDGTVKVSSGENKGFSIYMTLPVYREV